MGELLAAAGLLAVAVLVWALGRRDVTSVLIVYAVTLLALSPRLVVEPPFGAVGTPALLIAGGALCWWVFERLLPSSALADRAQPLRPALYLHGWVMLAGFAVAMMRPLTVNEYNGAHRAVFWLAALSGLALLAADGIETRDRLDTLLEWTVAGVGFMALVGILQFATGFDLNDVLRPPGLVLDRTTDQILNRLGFKRPAGTSTHPLEFAAVLATGLPLAIHYLRHAASRSRRAVAGVSTVLIAVALPMSLSRTALLGFLVASLLLAAAWSWRRRAQFLAATVAVVAGVVGLFPSLVTSFESLVFGAADDPSVTARIDRFDRVFALVAEAPVFGRGFGVWSIEDYFLLDNQYFFTVLETGIVGLVALLLLFVVAMSAARGARKRSEDPATRHLGQALAAALAVSLVGAATFDLLGFRMIRGLLFLLLGCAGALWRLAYREQDEREPRSLAGEFVDAVRMRPRETTPRPGAAT